MELTAEEVTNRSLYELCHAGDLAQLRQAHVDGKLAPEYGLK
jgi:hypothetical protein